MLPIDFDTMYEIHLFAVIPVLWAALRILKGPSSWYRGEALAWMLTASLLVRNELLLAIGLLAAMMLGIGLWRLRARHVRRRFTLGLLVILESRPTGEPFTQIR